jgi:hypothetical protein
VRPLAIDLFCGLGGWTEGLLAAGYYVVGFDMERHAYGEHRYPAQLVLQDVLTLHGSQFKDTALIVASPPCQEYSYMAMPWSRAKTIAAEYRSGVRDVKKLTALFDACFRIQREAIEAAGHHIPLVVENVRGAIPWVGRSRWNYGSFHLWGDVPALMPMTKRGAMKGCVGTVNGSGAFREQSSWDHANNPGFRFDGSGRSMQSESVDRHVKNGIEYIAVNGAQKMALDRLANGVKDRDADGCERTHPEAFGWKTPRTSSHSSARKAASALIAKIPLPLALHIAKSWYPQDVAA